MPVDLDLALDLIALIVGDDFQRVGFELLIHHQAIGGKSAEVGCNGIGGVGLGQFALDRQAERDHRRNRSLARIGIDQGAGKFAETIQGQNLGRRRHRTIDPEFYPRRCGLWRHIRHLEHKIRNVEFASRRGIGRRLPDRHRRGAAGHTRFQIRVAYQRQFVHRVQCHAIGDDVDRETIIRDRRAAARQVSNRRVDANLDTLKRAAFDPLDDPFADLRNDQRRPHPLQRGGRHRRSGETERQARLRRIVDTPGSGDADLAIADVGLGEQHAALVGVEAHADGDAIENQRRLPGVDRCKHDGAATQTELPIRNGIIRRLQMSEQREPVGAGNDLERRDQHTPPGIPFDVHFRRIDPHRIIGRIAVDDGSGAGADLAPEIGWQAVAAQFAFELAGEGQIRTVGQILQSQRQQDICRRDLVGANVDRSHAVGGRSDHDAKRPGMATFFAYLQRHPAAARPAKTEADILEIPFVAALLIVDDQISVLQADFIEVLSVEPGQAQAVEPVEPGKQATGRIAAPGSRWRGTGLGGARRWRGSRSRHRCGALS